MSDGVVAGNGYLEVVHYPVNAGRTWDQVQLLEAARKSKCRNTGWPIGVVLSSPDKAPKPVHDGIHASIRGESDFDDWSLEKHGAFHFVRRYEEDSEWSGVKNALFFNTRIWRVAEVFLHCAKLYQALDVSLTTEISIEVAHHGLKGRDLSSSGPIQALMMSGRKCKTDSCTWKNTVQLGLIEPNLESLIKDALGELFILFEFWQPEEKVWKQVLNEFLTSRI